MAKDSQRGSSADDEREPTINDALDDAEPTDDDPIETVDDDDPDLEDSDDEDSDDEDSDDEAVAAGAVRRSKRPAGAATKNKADRQAARKKTERKPSPIAGAAPGTFVQQVVSELSKVVWPTKKQMITYTTVVLIFVVALVTAIWSFDLGVGKVMDWIFA